jgi:hypothetical protein
VLSRHGLCTPSCAPSRCGRGSPVDTGLANREPYATLDGQDLKFRRITTRPFTLIPREDPYTVQFGGAIGDSPLNITYELIVV